MLNQSTLQKPKYFFIFSLGDSHCIISYIFCVFSPVHAYIKNIKACHLKFQSQYPASCWGASIRFNPTCPFLHCDSSTSLNYQDHFSSATKTEFSHWLAHNPNLHAVNMFKKNLFLFSQLCFSALENFLVNTDRSTSFSFMPFYNFFSFSWSHLKVRLLTYFLSYSSSLPHLLSLMRQFPDMQSDL